MKIKIGQRQSQIPSGNYHAKVIDITVGTFVGKRKTLQFTFEIADGESRGTQLKSWVNFHYESFSSHTKLYKWMGVVTKLDTEPGSEVDLNIFFEKILKVTVVTKISRKTQNHFSNVEDIIGVVCEL